MVGPKKKSSAAVDMANRETPTPAFNEGVARRAVTVKKALPKRVRWTIRIDEELVEPFQRLALETKHRDGIGAPELWREAVELLFEKHNHNQN
jgi:hypothetical protein